MKTKPFDLIKFLNKEPVIFRNGTKPLDIIYSQKAGTIIAFVSNTHTVTHNETGCFNLKNYEYDLLMETAVIYKSCWVNIYKYGKVQGGFESQEIANSYYDTQHYENIYNPRVACIEIHWEDDGE